MKTKRKLSPKKFEPIEITITLESLDDVYDLWHRTNMSGGSLRGSPYTHIGTHVPVPDIKTCSDLWMEMEKIVKEHYEK